MELKYIVKDKYIGKPIKNILINEFKLSNRLIIKLKKYDKIYCNDVSCFTNKILSKDDIVTVNLDFEEDNFNIVPCKMDLDIIYEDEYYIVVNKPPHMAVHPSCSHYDNSLSNGIRAYFDSINLKRKIRPINRLDKDTSGIVIFAKSEYIQECLIRQMQDKTFKKEYIGILDGILEKDFGTINLPIARKEKSIIERCIDENGDVAITHYDVIERKSNFTIVHFTLETGRTHQIRVHSKAIGHPILSDTLYFHASDLISRQALHSYKTSFVHPVTYKNVSYIAPIPKDMEFYR